MPLPEDYKELLKSDFADMNNMSSTRAGGAITAALFLSEFAADTRWAHIDIAGPAYLKSVILNREVLTAVPVERVSE
jgi:leucyl aminopeptidase